MAKRRSVQEWDINACLPLFLLDHDLMFLYGGDHSSLLWYERDVRTDLASWHPALSFLDQAERESDVHRNEKDRKSDISLPKIDIALGLGAYFRPDAVFVDEEGQVGLVEAKFAAKGRAISSRPDCEEVVLQALRYLARLVFPHEITVESSRVQGTLSRYEFLELLHRIQWWKSQLQFRFNGFDDTDGVRDGERAGLRHRHAWHYGLDSPLVEESFVAQPPYVVLMSQQQSSSAEPGPELMDIIELARSAPTYDSFLAGLTSKRVRAEGEKDSRKELIGPAWKLLGKRVRFYHQRFHVDGLKGLLGERRLLLA